ncbi:hypothetical protein CL657_03820 [bacterium]|nr:hypothetical protein [bacterium]
MYYLDFQKNKIRNRFNLEKTKLVKIITINSDSLASNSYFTYNNNQSIIGNSAIIRDAIELISEQNLLKLKK